MHVIIKNLKRFQKLAKSSEPIRKSAKNEKIVFKNEKFVSEIKSMK